MLTDLFIHGRAMQDPAIGEEGQVSIGGDTLQVFKPHDHKVPGLSILDFYFHESTTKFGQQQLSVRVSMVIGGDDLGEPKLIGHA